MPSLGSATFNLFTESSQFKAGMVESESIAAKTATGIQASMARARASIAGMGVTATKHAGLVGLGAVYLTLHEGVHTLMETEHATKLVEAAIKTTGGAANVTAAHAEKLSHAWEKVTGAHLGETFQLEQLLLRFRSVRNEVGAGNNVFDRAVTAIQNVTAATGRGLMPTTIALGKALQDPSKYLNMLARSGITFTKQQVDMVKEMQKTKGILAAQTYVLDQIDKRYRGAAAAAGQSFAGQLKIARAQLDESAATITRALIPAFLIFVHMLQTVASLMSQHTTLVKTALLAWLAWKGALIAIGIVVRANARIVKIFGASAAAGATEAEVPMATLERTLQEMLISLRGVNVQLETMGAAAVKGGTVAEAELTSVGAAADTAKLSVFNFGRALLGLAGAAPGIAILAGAFYKAATAPNPKTVVTRKAGGLPANVVISGGRYYIAAGRALTPFTGTLPDGRKVVAGEVVATKDEMAPGTTTGTPGGVKPHHAAAAGAALDRQSQLLLSLDRANRTKAQSQILAALTALVSFEDTYIAKQEKLLKTDVAHRKVHADILHRLYGERDSYQSQIDSIHSAAASKSASAARKAAAKAKAAAKVHAKEVALIVRSSLDEFNRIVKEQQKELSRTTGLIPADLRIALSKAQRDDTDDPKTLKNNRAVLLRQEHYLEGLLQNFKGTKDRRAAIEKEITRVVNDIKAINKKIKGKAGETARDFADLEREFMSEQAGFWASFGSNTFTQGGANGRMPGGRTGANVQVNQTFPAGREDDAEGHARYARMAMGAAFDGA